MEQKTIFYNVTEAPFKIYGLLPEHEENGLFALGLLCRARFHAFGGGVVGSPHEQNRRKCRNDRGGQLCKSNRSPRRLVRRLFNCL